MSENEVLHTVTRGQRVWLFRTRQAARNFRNAKRAPKQYRLGRANWGPES